jgi:hypothetical protein
MQIGMVFSSDDDYSGDCLNIGRRLYVVQQPVEPIWQAAQTRRVYREK